MTNFLGRSGSSPLTRGKLTRSYAARIQRRLIPAHAGKTRTMRAARVSAAAHPRSRGENSFRPITILSPAGSSPLTRGKPSTWTGRPSPRRLIPAHAGKTQSFGRTRRGRPAHPRSRGENEIQGAVGQSLSGSSPLTRGKPPGSSLSPRRRWLIPAHAGKTSRACADA